MYRQINGSLISKTEEEWDEIDAIAKTEQDAIALSNETYAQKRAREYPNFYDYIDAQVKKHSDNQTIVDEGKNQELTYLESCIAIKNKYPKT